MSPAPVSDTGDEDAAAAAFRRSQWRVLHATSFCYLFYYTGRQNFGWAITGIREDLALSNLQIGWISGTALVFYGLGQMVSGPAADRFGGRWMVAAGAALSCLLNWVTSFGRGFAGLAIPWAINNLVQSMGFAPASRVIANWWGPRERGLAFGIFNFAAGLSSALTFVSALAVLAWLPWVWLFRLPVLLLPLGALVFVVSVREHPGGEGPSGAAGADDTARRGLPVPEIGGARAFVAPYRDILGNARFLVACLGFGFTNWGRLALLVWVPVHFLGAGWRDDPTSAWITVALPVGMALGALVAGYSADRLFHADHPRLITFFLLLASIASTALFLTPRGPAGVALLFLAGFFLFGSLGSFTSLCPDLVGLRAAATAIGFMNAVGYGVAALGDLVVGTVLDVTGSTTWLFPIAALACLAGATCMFSVRR